jgi:hypothetical protein
MPVNRGQLTISKQRHAEKGQRNSCTRYLLVVKQVLDSKDHHSALTNDRHGADDISDDVLLEPKLCRIEELPKTDPERGFGSSMFLYPLFFKLVSAGQDARPELAHEVYEDNHKRSADRDALPEELRSVSPTHWLLTSE